MNNVFSIADDIKREVFKQDEANVNKPDETIPGTKCTVFIKQIIVQ